MARGESVKGARAAVCRHREGPRRRGAAYVAPCSSGERPLREAAVKVSIEAREILPGKTRRDCGEGKYDIAYDDGDEKPLSTRVIRKLQLRRGHGREKGPSHRRAARRPVTTREPRDGVGDK